jgi:cysteine desulfurase / selenocysteine lyase
VKAAATGGSFDVESLRREYPALERRVSGKRLIYLDNACTALKSQAVASATARFYEETGACGGKRSTHLLAQQVEESVRLAREAARRFLNAESVNEIVFTSGVTEAANLLARAFPYEDGRREVVITDLEHNAVFLPFYEAAKRGECELIICRTKNGLVKAEDIDRAVTNKTALVAITHASNVAGGVVALDQIVRISRAKGARTFVDDAQYLSSHREDVQALQADFVAFSAHKLGGPFGLGVLFGKEQELNRLRHYELGGGVVKSVRWSGRGLPEVDYLDAPMRLEPGVANFAAFPAFVEAIGLLESLPPKVVRAHVGGLAARLAKRLERVGAIGVVGKAHEQGSLVAFHAKDSEFSIPDFNLFLNHELDGRFIAVRAGEHCAHLLHQSLGLDATVRASFFAYNTAEEADAFADAVDSYAREAVA